MSIILRDLITRAEKAKEKECELLDSLTDYATNTFFPEVVETMKVLKVDSFIVWAHEKLKAKQGLINVDDAQLTAIQFLLTGENYEIFEGAGYHPASKTLTNFIPLDGDSDFLLPGLIDYIFKIKMWLYEAVKKSEDDIIKARQILS